VAPGRPRARGRVRRGGKIPPRFRVRYTDAASINPGGPMHARAGFAAALAVAVAACGGGPASPPALAYRLPSPAESSYDVFDTATISIQALGQSLDLRVRSAAIYDVAFARAGDGVEVTMSI